MSERSTLECPHCGCAARTSDAKGLFYDDGVPSQCDTCGFPGRVRVDEGDHEHESEAWWAASESPHARCRRRGCDGCPDVGGAS